ncbi:MAG: polyprenyl diphosphate synthase [Anaerolineae bacterium]
MPARLVQDALTIDSLDKVPYHVAIIMDGNGRWARSRNLPRIAGHRAGVENLRLILRSAAEFGISILTVYAFSTENWGRPGVEVRALLNLFEEAIDHELAELQHNGVKFHHIGLTTGIEPRLVKKLHQVEQATSANSRITLNVAFNYGGRAEIVDAFRRMLAEKLTADEVTEETLGSHLTTAGQPDPDLVIRTAGEMRLSNFLVWQTAYSEYYTTQVYWPDFNRSELFRALIAFQQRKRRFGKLDSDATIEVS